MLTVQDNTTMVRAHYDAFNRRDIEKSLSLVTHDAKWMNIPFNVNFTGHAGFREFITNWTTAMPDCKVEIVTLMGGDEWAVVELVARGTHTGPLAGPQGTFPATQKKLEIKVCEILKIKDGQIFEAHVYFDAATMLRQFGLLPQTHVPNQPVASSRP